MIQERRMDNSEWPQWMHEAWNGERGVEGSLYPTHKSLPPAYSLPPIEDHLNTLSIGTLEGEHLISWGDWIIQGVKGEIYPCKPDIFEMTYEPVEDK